MKVCGRRGVRTGTLPPYPSRRKEFRADLTSYDPPSTAIPCEASHKGNRILLHSTSHLAFPNAATLFSSSILSILPSIMTYQTVGIAVLAFIALIVKYLNRTDTPKIKNIPEVPGVPLFGNLLQFGSTHAKVAGKLAEKYGPVFQVRLGNRVCRILPCGRCHAITLLTRNSASSLPTRSPPSNISGSPTNQP